MEIILSKQALKKLELIKKSDYKYASLIKKKLILIKENKIQLVQLKWFKGLYKQRVWKYRIIFTFWENYVKIVILERRDLVYSLVDNLFR